MLKYSKRGRPGAPYTGMFDPQGNVGTVQDRPEQAARAAGGRCAVDTIDPYGTHGWVPENEVHAAEAAGGLVVKKLRVHIDPTTGEPFAVDPATVERVSQNDKDVIRRLREQYISRGRHKVLKVLGIGNVEFLGATSHGEISLAIRKFLAKPVARNTGRSLLGPLWLPP